MRLRHRDEHETIGIRTEKCIEDVGEFFDRQVCGVIIFLVYALARKSTLTQEFFYRLLHQETNIIHEIDTAFVAGTGRS